MKMLKMRLLTLAALYALTNAGLAADDLAKSFSAPPDSARPGVYWYFMDGNQDRAASPLTARPRYQSARNSKCCWIWMAKNRSLRLKC